MKQEVNLYTDAFRPSQEWLTLNRVAVMAAVALLFVLVAMGWTRYQLVQLQAEQVEVEQQRERAESAMESLNQQMARQQKDPQLVDQVDRLEARVEDRKRLLERADSVARASSEGFTPYLEGLAMQSREGLWLTRIRVNLIRDRLHLEGRTTQGQQVPDYLQRLRKESVFEGRRFERFGIERNEQTSFLDFNVASRRDTGEEDE